MKIQIFFFFESPKCKSKFFFFSNTIVQNYGIMDYWATESNWRIFDKIMSQMTKERCQNAIKTLYEGFKTDSWVFFFFFVRCQDARGQDARCQMPGGQMFENASCQNFRFLFLEIFLNFFLKFFLSRWEGLRWGKGFIHWWALYH